MINSLCISYRSVRCLKDINNSVYIKGHVSKNITIMKLIYFSSGWFFFFIGLIGTVLPVLPTTPFMLLALWCFSRSSDRFHQWLYQHRFFGPTLQQWEQNKVIPLSAKVMAVSMMVASYTYLVFFRSQPVAVLIIVGLIMLYGLWFILTKPSKPID